MRTTLLKMRRLCSAAPAIAAFLAALPSPAHAQTTPVGSWDYAISGRARGVAQITFNGNGTLIGGVIIETRKDAAAPTADVNPRGPNTADRGDTDTPPPTTTVTNFFGSAAIDGMWSFDAAGKVIGYLNQGARTVTLTTTNFVTNSYSFRATVKGGTSPRMTLVTSGVLGHSTYQGVPLQNLTDISGDLRATGSRLSGPVTEFYTLSPLGANNYTVTGSGLGFTFSGQAILVGRKQLGMVTLSNGTNDYILTSIVGSFNTNKLSGSLVGRDTKGKVSLKVF